MNKQTSSTKPSEKNGKDSIDSKSDENLSQSISPIGQILQMQQTIGNQAVQELFKSGAIQAKLKISQPGNQYEQEADQAADCITQNIDYRENQLSPVEPQIQRAPANENQTPPPSPPPETQTETTTRTTVPLPGLIVEDTATVLANGQMKKSQFLDQVQVEVCRTVNRILEGTGYSTDSCPYIQFYLYYYRTKSSQHIERAMLRYAPEAAGAKTAKDYINFIIARVAMATVIWLNTGEVTGVPEGFAAAAPGEGSEGEGTAVGISPKARAGGVRNADNVQAIQSRLGPGQPLDGGIRSRLGSAFGQDFSHVRIHTYANASQLSDSLNARAFTIGKDIAFASGEYRPGTLIGDALIAHELAHTVQQRGGSSTTAPMQKGLTENNTLEEDADRSALGAMVSLWGSAKESMGHIAQHAVPLLQSGLRLQRCERKRKPSDLIKNGEWKFKEMPPACNDHPIEVSSDRDADFGPVPATTLNPRYTPLFCAEDSITIHAEATSGLPKNGECDKRYCDWSMALFYCNEEGEDEVGKNGGNISDTLEIKYRWYGWKKFYIRIQNGSIGEIENVKLHFFPKRF